MSDQRSTFVNLDPAAGPAGIKRLWVEPSARGGGLGRRFPKERLGASPDACSQR